MASKAMRTEVLEAMKTHRRKVAGDRFVFKQKSRAGEWVPDDRFTEEFRQRELGHIDELIERYKAII